MYLDKNLHHMFEIERIEEKSFKRRIFVHIPTYFCNHVAKAFYFLAVSFGSQQSCWNLCISVSFYAENLLSKFAFLPSYFVIGICSLILQYIHRFSCKISLGRNS